MTLITISLAPGIKLAYNLGVYFVVFMYAFGMAILVSLFIYQIWLIERLRFYLVAKFPTIKIGPFIHPLSICFFLQPWQYISKQLKFFRGLGLTIGFRLIFNFGSRRIVREYLTYIMDYEKLRNLNIPIVNKYLEEIGFTISIFSKIFFILYLSGIILLVYVLLLILINYIIYL